MTAAEYARWLDAVHARWLREARYAPFRGRQLAATAQTIRFGPETGQGRTQRVGVGPSATEDIRERENAL